MPGIYHSRKYEVNENFFSSWSSNMAYVLGFWFADGYMRHEKSYRTLFFSCDHEHLYQIKKAMNSRHRLKACYSKKSKIPCFELQIFSKQIFSDLYSLGGRRAKSRTMPFPKVPREFMADFIRGYFDGDGSVHYIKYKHSKNGKFYTNIRSNFTSGSEQFLEAVRDFLAEELSLYLRKICQYGPAQFKLGYAQKDTETLLSYMYYPGYKIGLQKKAVFLNYF